MRQNKQSFSVLSLWRWLFLLVALVSLYFVVGVNTERTLAQQPNANSAAQNIQTKRLTPLRTSETPDGSRVRITSDGELNDYSAYRSGDRFIVIVPQAEGAGSGARGRGFKGAQVERRGTDLVYTFKLQPGATARVNQRFNRLDVQFSAPRAAGGQSLNNANVRPAATLALKPTRRPLPEEAGIIKPPANANTPPPDARRAPEANANNVAANRSPTPFAVASSNVAALPGVAPMPVLAPTSTPLDPEQLAQAQPTSAATVSITTNASATTSTSVGAVVLRNWPWLMAALLAVGIGLLFVTRFSGGDRDKIGESPTAKTKSIADETKAAHEETKVIEVDETNTLAVAVPLMEPALAEEATTEVETATTRVETDLASSAVEPYSTPSESIAAGVSELTTETPSVEPQPAPPVSETSRQGPVSLFDSLEIETSETNALKPTPIAEPTIDLEHFEDAMMEPLTFETHSPTADEHLRSTGVVKADKDLSLVDGSDEDNYSIIPKAIQMRLASDDSSERAASLLALSRLNTDEAFSEICAAFDDSQEEVRNAAARALYDLNQDRAESFARALRESPVERRRQIGAALAGSGLADEAIGNLTGESRDKTYDAFSLLFLMAKAGEGAPLIRAIESHADNEVRLAVVKLLALSGQQEILPAFRRLAVRGSLPAEVRFAVMEAIYQISSQLQNATPTAS